MVTTPSNILDRITHLLSLCREASDKALPGIVARADEMAEDQREVDTILGMINRVASNGRAIPGSLLRDVPDEAPTVMRERAEKLVGKEWLDYMRHPSNHDGSYAGHTAGDWCRFWITCAQCFAAGMEPPPEIAVQMVADGKGFTRDELLALGKELAQCATADPWKTADAAHGLTLLRAKRR